MTPRIGGLALSGVLIPASGALACGAPDIPVLAILPVVGTLYLVPVLASILFFGGLYSVAGWQALGLARMGAVIRILGSSLALFAVANAVWIPLGLLFAVCDQTVLEAPVAVALYAVGIFGVLGPMLLGPALFLRRSEAGFERRFNTAVAAHLFLAMCLGWGATILAFGVDLFRFSPYLTAPAVLLYGVRTLTRAIDWVVAEAAGRSMASATVRGTVAALASPAPCPVCRSVIPGEAWICDDCHMPQHLECHEYQGRCASYGCGVTPVTRSASPTKG